MPLPLPSLEAKKKDIDRIKDKLTIKPIKANGASQPVFDGSTRNGSTIQKNVRPKYPKPNPRPQMKASNPMGSYFTQAAPRTINETKAENGKSKGICPVAKLSPKRNKNQKDFL